jgi:hypothetical protein
MDAHICDIVDQVSLLKYQSAHLAHQDWTACIGGFDIHIEFRQLAKIVLKLTEATYPTLLCLCLCILGIGLHASVSVVSIPS